MTVCPHIGARLTSERTADPGRTQGGPLFHCSGPSGSLSLGARAKRACLESVPRECALKRA
eukprot:6027541-Alexandrium_andersonii.AAC.1